MRSGSMAIVFTAGFFTLFPVTSFTDDGGVLYVKENYQTLQDAPDGRQIAFLSQSTELTVIEENNEWVKVTVTGWIKKLSTVKDLSNIEGATVDTTTPAGKGFVYRNVSLREGPNGGEFAGEMTNGSGKDYEEVMFVLTLFDEDGELIETSFIEFSSFKNGTTQTFTAPVKDATYEKVHNFKIIIVD